MSQTGNTSVVNVHPANNIKDAALRYPHNYTQQSDITALPRTAAPTNFGHDVYNSHVLTSNVVSVHHSHMYRRSWTYVTVTFTYVRRIGVRARGLGAAGPWLGQNHYFSGKSYSFRATGSSPKMRNFLVFIKRKN